MHIPCRWLVPENEKLDQEARNRYDSEVTHTPSQWKKVTQKTNAEDTTSAASATTPSAAVPKKKSGTKQRAKKNIYHDLPQGNRVFFLMDLETTGSKRNWDRGIEYSILAYTEDGQLIDNFYSRVNNDGVRIKPSAYAVHGISYAQLRGEPKFAEVGRRIKSFFEKCLQHYDAGVLVAHNGATDFQFL